MAESTGQEAAGKETGTVVAKAAETKAEQRLSEQEQKALNVFNNIDSRYRTDAKFKEIMDKAWAGKYEEFVKKEEAIKTKESVEDDDDPEIKIKRRFDDIEKRNEKLNEELGQVRNAYAWDKVSGVRQNINEKYEQEFCNLAEASGYKFGTSAYDNLFDSAIRESNVLAKKYGLVGEDGQADPLIKFTPELVKEAFDRAFDKHKKMGFDIQEYRKKEMMAKREEKLKREDQKWEAFLDKKKLATPQGRAQQMQSMFNARLRELGVDPKALKFS